MNAPVQVAEPAAEPARVHPVKAANDQLSARQTDFAAALPAHIPVERFMRVVMTAVQRNPALAAADRASLFNSALMAAQDGLLPDGREGALVIYRTRVKRNGADHWIEAVQWMPMVAGILKKVRNSGELASIVARVVYAGDKFRSWVDDTGEHIEYEADPEADHNTIRCVFAMAKLKDGTIEVEVLRPADIEKIRNVSRSKDKGPWVDWWDEMAKKSAIRRLSKRLPLSTDLDDVIRRDDALYDLDGASDKSVRLAAPKTIAGRLDALAPPPPHDPETGEIADENNAAGAQPAQEREAAGSTPASAAASQDAGGRADPPATPPASDNLDHVRIAQGMARHAAGNGMASLADWRENASAAEIDAADAIFDELSATAKRADAEKAKGGATRR